MRMQVIFPEKSYSQKASERRRRVLVLAGNSQVGLWVVRSLGRSGLTVFSICSDSNGLAAHSRYSQGAWFLDVGPRNPRFVEEIETLARELNVASIIPIDEGHHLALILNRAQFEPDIHIFSPQAECFQKATDKDYMHNLCLQLQVPVARSTTLDKLMDETQDVSLRFPLVMRTRNQTLPQGGKRTPWKAAYALNSEQLQCLHQSVADITSNVLVQEYHPGVEVHIQILMYQGEAFMVGEYIGEHHMPLAGGVTVQRITCTHERLRRDAIRLLQAIHWEGIAAVQYHYDTDTDEYIFLEINPRFCGGLPTVIMAGFDAPFLLWQSHYEPENMKKAHYQLGVRSRILGGDANWMLGMMRGDELPPDQKRLSKVSAAGRFLWNCLPWTKEDVFWLRDLKPSWIDFRQMLTRLKESAGNL
jgi:predicted ATP-grasp superfamily ATP-dependent carboligase